MLLSAGSCHDSQDSSFSLFAIGWRCHVIFLSPLIGWNDNNNDSCTTDPSSGALFKLFYITMADNNCNQVDTSNNPLKKSVSSVDTKKKYKFVDFSKKESGCVAICDNSIVCTGCTAVSSAVNNYTCEEPPHTRPNELGLELPSEKLARRIYPTADYVPRNWRFLVGIISV